MDDLIGSGPEARRSRRRRPFWGAYSVYAVGVVLLLLLGSTWGLRRIFPARWEAIAELWLLPGHLLLMVVALVRGIHEGFPTYLGVVLTALGCLAAPPLAAQALRAWRSTPTAGRHQRAPHRRRVYFTYNLLVAAVTVGATVLVAGRGPDAREDMLAILPAWAFVLLLPGFVLSTAIYTVVFESIICPLLGVAAGSCLRTDKPIWEVSGLLLTALFYLALPLGAGAVYRRISKVLRRKD